MINVLQEATRSRMISAVKNKNTKPEILIRKLLYSFGYRYRLHAKNIFGRPDIAFNKLKTVIFINGCFWHKHNCDLFTWPKNRADFWKEKIEGNTKRDNTNYESLIKEGWKVIIIWGCTIKGKHRISEEVLRSELLQSMSSSNKKIEIKGNYGKILECMTV